MCKSEPSISHRENSWKRTANCVARHVKLSVAGFGTRNADTKTLNKLHSASIQAVWCDTLELCNTRVRRESQLLTACTVHTIRTDFRVSPCMALTDWLTDWPIYSNWHIRQLSRPILRDFEHINHQGVLNCQKATRFHSARTSLTSVTHKRKAQPSRRLAQNSPACSISTPNSPPNIDTAGSSSCTFSEQNGTELGLLTQDFAKKRLTKLHENTVTAYTLTQWAEAPTGLQ